MKKITCLLICLLSSSANALVIGFDSLETANANLNNISPGIYSESGFTIQGSPMFYAGQSNNEYAGSAGLHLRASNAVITLFNSSATVFSIDSIGLSVLNPNGSSPAVTFTGLLSGGGTVTQSFQPLAFGFTDFYFNAGFTNLTSLKWNQGQYDSYAHQFDNIKLNVADIPEPASLALLGIGLAGMGFSRKKKNR